MLAIYFTHLQNWNYPIYDWKKKIKWKKAILSVLTWRSRSILFKIQIYKILAKKKIKISQDNITKLMTK